MTKTYIRHWFGLPAGSDHPAGQPPHRVDQVLDDGSTLEVSDDLIDDSRIVSSDWSDDRELDHSRNFSETVVVERS